MNAAGDNSRAECEWKDARKGGWKSEWEDLREGAFNGELNAAPHAQPFVRAQDELMRLAHARGPLRDVLAQLSARFAATQGWSRLGFARMSDYARERLGLSQRALQDFACIGARLDALPALREALQCGRLPWSKVRLLARFVETGRGDRGDPEEYEEYERAWITYAQARSVKTLERELRAVDRGALEAGSVGAGEVSATDGEAKREWVRISAPRSLAFKWQRAKKQARRVAGAPLPPGDVLELVVAEVMAALPVRLEWEEEDGEDREARARRSSASVEQETSTCDVGVPTTAVESTTAWIEPAVAGTSGKKESVSRAPRASSHSRVARGSVGEELHRPPPEPPAFLSRLLQELDEADAFELDARLRRAVRLEQRLDSQIAPLVRVVMAAEYEWQGERPTMAALAQEGLGMSPSKLRALLRIERVGSLCPALLEAYRDGALSWSQACVLAPLLDSEAEGDPRRDWRGRWVGFALGVTGLRLKRAVEHARDLAQTDPERFELHREEPEWFALASFGDGDDPRSGDKGDHGDRDDQVDAADERQKCAHPTGFAERVRMTFQAPVDVARLFRAVTCTLRRAIERRTGQLPSVAEVFETMLTHALDSWGLDDDPWLKKNMSRKYLAVLERDGWRCVFPGCTSQRNLHVHHIRFRSAGGGDEARNLTTLCAFHHLRGVHGGTARVEGAAPDGLEFALGLRAGREPLVRYRSGGRVVG